MSKRKRDYLFKPEHSQFWHLRLQHNGKSVQRSLRTTDRMQAEILAAPLIAEHKRRLIEARPRFEAAWLPQYEPGLHTLPDGQRVFATGRELHYLGTDGDVIQRERNGGPGFNVVNLPKGEIIRVPHFDTAPVINATVIPAQSRELRIIERPKLATKDTDDALFETYLKHADVTGYYEREARNVWALFKTLTDGKALKDCTRDDGRKLVAHFEDQGLKSASIRKKVMWLRAAVNLAISEGKLAFNPFSGVAPKKRDNVRRLPLDDADMAEAMRNLDKLGEADQILFRLLASTGMRLSEAFEIDREHTEGGYRYVIVGKKTEQSERRVPLPASALPYLPQKITQPLFRGTTNDASKRLNRFLNDCSIVDPRKVVHSLRHRAQDQLRAAGCPEDVRWALLGHEQKTVADGYGEGFPVPLLRKWIDKISPPGS
ncbi:MAG: tyrosine recombinase XerC [Xanthobacteraceae bacterium]